MVALFEAANSRLYWAPTTFMRSSLLWAVHAAVVAALLLANLSAEADSAAIPNPDTEGLPPRTLHTGPPLCAPIPWVQTELLVAHLPPADWRQIQEYVKAGYQVIAVNTLAQWDRVGPRSNDYPAQVVQEADAYLQRDVA